jgi:hypothetical protein
MTARPPKVWASPALVAVPDGQIPAYEVKFLVTEAVARAVEAWAAGHLARDPFGDPARGHGYRVTSVYFDTPGYDVYRRADGYGPHKYRVRRYGDEPTAHLERKSKQDERVWKYRTAVPLGHLADLSADGTAVWFAREVADLNLRPVCRVTYDRVAFVGTGPAGPIRLTLDRAAVGAAADGCHPDPAAGGAALLGDEVIAEFKFLAGLPDLFRDVIVALRLLPSAVSKYRRCAAAIGVAPPEPSDPL